MARPSATDQLSRILAIVPWIAEQGAPLIADVCARFVVTREQLLADLAVVPMVGLYPYTPDNLIELVVDDDRVRLEYGNFFERPLRLSKEEALVLITAGTAWADQQGHDPDGPLARGLAKIADVLGVDLDADLSVVLGTPSGDAVGAIDAAVQERRVLHIEYFSHARNEQTERDVEPLRLFHTEGAWYLDAFCRTSQDHRVFRVDRITDLSATDERFDRTARRDSTDAFRPSADLARVTLEVDPDGAWVGDQYPVEDVEELPGGGRRVTLVVSARPWLERLLLRLGPHGRIVGVRGPGAADLEDTGSRAARRLLDRYGV